MKMSSKIAAGVMAAGIMAAPVGTAVMSATASAATPINSSTATGTREYYIHDDLVTFYPNTPGSHLQPKDFSWDAGTTQVNSALYPNSARAVNDYNSATFAFTSQARDVQNLKNGWMRSEIEYGKNHPRTVYAHALYLQEASRALKSTNATTRIQVLSNPNLDKTVQMIMGSFAMTQTPDTTPASITADVDATQRAFDAAAGPIRAQNSFGWIPFFGYQYNVNAANAVRVVTTASDKSIAHFGFVA